MSAERRRLSHRVNDFDIGLERKSRNVAIRNELELKSSQKHE
jgi:hypothetical protein